MHARFWQTLAQYTKEYQQDFVTGSFLLHSYFAFWTLNQ
jgi:hypothetical protein